MCLGVVCLYMNNVYVVSYPVKSISCNLVLSNCLTISTDTVFFNANYELNFCNVYRYGVYKL